MRRFVQYVSAQFAFFPPRPPTYNFLENAQRQLAFGGDDKDFRSSNLMYLNTTRGEKIALMSLRYPGAKTTVVFSHGNAVDMGIMRYFYLEMNMELKVNVIGFDYTGYGASSGEPSVDATLADIEAVYEWLVASGTDPADIVLYGQSVGSGPSTHLAAELSKSGVPLGGLVLHSPLMSGVRVLYPATKRWPNWADVFPNHDLIKKVTCPVAVLHGTEDEVIHISHGEFLHNNSPHAFRPLFAEGFGHQDLEHSSAYYPHLADFFEYCRKHKGGGGAGAAGRGAGRGGGGS